MKEIDRELLSRILDEDASEFEAQRILKEMRSSPELHATFQRYNIIGHAMRKQLPARINYNFTNEVMGRLSGGPISDSAASVQAVMNPNRMKIAMGLAIAASIAILSLITIQNLIRPNASANNIPVVAERSIEASKIQQVIQEDLQNFLSNPRAAEEFNSYIVNHVEYASPRMSMPHARIVGYDQGEYNQE